MAHRLPEDRKEEVRRATDVVALVQRYIPLRKSGRSFSACCPFHQERTPSFHVWPESQRWKCFSCSRSGDAFSFVMEKEGVDFPEALRMLARDAGIEIDRPDPGAADAARAKDAALEACAWACAWFEGNLRGSPGADYLKGRGLTGATAKEWRLGFAPAGWDGLLAAARGAGIAPATLDAAGLVVPRKQGDGFYDRFRDRVMFPIADVRGRVVGFGARALGDEEPKYLNTPDSAVFHKGTLLFGLDRARDEAMRTRSLAVMEGYMDVIMAHQHGVRTAVAGLGTAFTTDHAALMRRFADRVVLVYDADKAGQTATDRAVHVLFEVGLDCRIALVPEGKDPCDLLVLRGAPALLEAIEKAKGLFEHFVSRTLLRHDLGSVGGRAAATDEILRFAILVNDDVQRSMLIEGASARLGLPEGEIKARARALIAASAPMSPEAEKLKAMAKGRMATSPATDTGGQREKLLLEAALRCPGMARRMATEFPPELFSTSSLASIARAVVSTSRDGNADPASCASSLNDEVLADEVAALTEAGATKPDSTLLRQFEDCLHWLVNDRSIAEARRRYADAAAIGDQAEESRWFSELTRLQSERKRRPDNDKR